jgi:hypothetical protein
MRASSNFFDRQLSYKGATNAASTHTEKPIPPLIKEGDPLLNIGNHLSPSVEHVMKLYLHSTQF